MKVLFWTYKGRLDKKGTMPFMLRVTYNGIRVNINLNRRVEATSWDSKKQRFRGTSENSTNLNALIISTSSRLHAIYTGLLTKGARFDAYTIISAFEGNDTKRTLLETYKDHLIELERKIDLTYAKVSVMKYKTTYKKLVDYLLFIGRHDISLDLVDRHFVKGFFEYLVTTRRTENNTAVKNLKCLRAAFNVWRMKEYVFTDPFEFVSLKENQAQRGYLSGKEVSQLKELKELSTGLEIARDVFLFQVYTGLSHSDVRKLSTIHIKLTTDNMKWIHIQRTKTGVLSQIPLLPEALKILEKYSNNNVAIKNGTLLPVQCNQRMNRALKELQSKVTVSKKLTTHLARHTFATTLMLSNGVSLETTAAMLGHSDIKTTSIYAKVTEYKIAKEIKLLSLKLADFD